MTITSLMKKTTIALISVAFAATLLVPAIAENKPMNMDMKNGSMSRSTHKANHKVKHHKKYKHVQKPKNIQKAWPASKSNKVKTYQKHKPGDRSQSNLEKGLNTSARKASEFTKRTFTVPQKNPNASKRPADRSKSTLQRGVGTSAHKAGKFLKKTFTAPHKTPPVNGKN